MISWVVNVNQPMPEVTAELVAQFQQTGFGIAKVLLMSVAFEATVRG